MQRLKLFGRLFLALASSALLLISGVVAPPLGVILIPMVPQPVLSFGLKYGIGWAAAGITAAVLLLMLFAGTELAVLYGLFALIAVLLFALMGRVRSIELLVTVTAAAVSVVTAGLLFYSFGSWAAMEQDFRASMLQHLSSAAGVHERMGFPQESLEVLKERAPQIIEMILQVAPALLFLTLALVVLMNFLLLCRRFPERRPEWLALANLREWKGPERLVWGLILCGFILFIPGFDGLRFVAANLLLVIAAFYFAQGLAIVGYFFHKNNVPRFLRWVTYVLIGFEQIFTLLIVGLGLFDLWGDFRRLRKNDLHPSRAS
jgi:uncharacterized protein YybS (DUF2232 family)